MSRPVMLYGGWERKQARDAPAGPAPTMSRGVSTTLSGESPLTVDVSPMFA